MLPGLNGVPAESPTLKDPRSVWQRAASRLAAFVAQLSSTSSVSDGDALIGVKYEAPSAVALNLHKYIEDDGAYNVMGFVADADKAAIRAGTSTTDQSSAITIALTAAYAESPKGLRFAAGKYPVIAGATLTVSGNRTNNGFRISGVGQYGSRIVKLSGSNAPLTIIGSTPTTLPIDVGLSISDLGLVGASKGSHGLALTGIAIFELERLAIRGFDRGLQLLSTLIGQVRSCYISDNNTGVITRQNGSNANCNAIEFQACAIKYNSTWGLDIGEANGISVTGWSDVELNGTAADLSTGGIILRSTIGDDSGIGIVSLDKVWLEGNRGRTIDVESSTDLYLTVRQANILSPEGGRAMRVQGGRSVCFENSVAAGNTATLDITCERFTAKDALADVITDASTYNTYINVGTSAASYPDGRTDTFTGTLTGCTTAPTKTISVLQRGRTITLILATPFVGTSNSTACKITGIPARYRPSAQKDCTGICTDNGSDKFSQISVTSAGEILLNNGLTSVFTGSGTKGAQFFRIEYEIA